MYADANERRFENSYCKTFLVSGLISVTNITVFGIYGTAL